MLDVLTRARLLGYVFKDAAHISRYLERPFSGLTSQFCRDLAQKLQCHIVAGFPEKVSDDDEASVVLQPQKRSKHVGYNSAIMYSPDGKPAGTYRKTHLYPTDATWAAPGTGFTAFTLPSPLRTVSLGICMDLNAQIENPFELGPGPYELAEHAVTSKSRLLVLLNNWLDSGVNSHEDVDWSTLEFWSQRLRPLWSKRGADGWLEDKMIEHGEDEDVVDDETIVVACNRCGEENGSTFAGSSALFSMRPSIGRPRLLDVMGRREEGIRTWNLLV